MRTTHALTEESLVSAAEIGGVAVGYPGERKLEVTFTAEGSNRDDAREHAIKTVTDRIDGTIEKLVITPVT